MEIARYTTDVHGPVWQTPRPASVPLNGQNVNRTFRFIQRVWRHMEQRIYISAYDETPEYMPIIACPNTFSSGTNRKVHGRRFFININNVSSRTDLNAYRGKLRDAIVCIDPKVEMLPHFEPIAVRYTEEQLDELSQAVITPPEQGQSRPRRALPGPSRDEIIDFLFSEGTAAIVFPDRTLSWLLESTTTGSYASSKRAYLLKWR